MPKRLSRNSYANTFPRRRALEEMIEGRKIRSIVDSGFPMEQADDAHRLGVLFANGGEHGARNEW